MPPSSQPPSGNIAGKIVLRIFGTLFFGVFATAGGLGTAVLGKAAWKSVQTRFWTQTPCTILEVRDEAAALERTAKNKENVAIRYRYTTAGKEYVSDAITTDGLHSAGESRFKLLSRYRPNDQVVCWVNPGRPEEAVLQRDSPWMGLLVLFPCVFLAVGLGGIVGVWRMKLDGTASRGNGPATPISANRTTGVAAARMIGGIFLVVGTVLFVVITVLPGLKMLRARSWKETPCTVLGSRVISSRSSKSTTYRPEIIYSYEIAGREYRSDQFDFFGASSSGRTGKERTVKGYPVGRKTVCFVDPENPSEAVLRRGFSPIVFIGFFPLLFVGLGIGLLFARSPKSRLSASPALPVPGSTPSLPAVRTGDGRIALRSKASPVARLIGGLCIAGFWNGIVSIFVYQLVQEWLKGRREWFGAIFLLPFEAVGLFFIGFVGHAFLNLFNPRVHMTVTSDTIPLGGTLDAQWTTRGAVTRIRRFQITLEGIEETKSGTGKNSRTHTSVFARLPLLDTADTARIQAGAARLNLPAETMHSFNGGNNKILWTLKVSGEIAWYPDVTDEFPITLVPAGT